MSPSRMILKRGWQRLCPQCGKTPLYKGWNKLQPHCQVCGLRYIRDPIDFGAFLYFSTALITGLYVMAFLIVGFPSSWWARTVIILTALLLMWVTLPWRKGLAVALDYWNDWRANPESELKLQDD